MDIDIRHDTENNEFVLYSADGKKMGEICYSPSAPGELLATHTEVQPQYEGQGVAAYLLDALVHYANSIDAKIVPSCSYVKHAFQRHPDKYASVIK